MIRRCKQLLKRILGPTWVRRISVLRRKAHGLLLRFGNEVYCPICGTSYSHFLAFNTRANAQCPKCFSLKRHRLLYLFLGDEPGFFQTPKKVLHFAPEACLYRVFRECAAISYTTADLMVAFNALYCVKPDILMSVTDIQSEDNAYDVVLCNHVLEHVRDDGKAMREILRVLRPGGFAILGVPVDMRLANTDEDPTLGPEERAKRYGFADHLRLYGRDYPDRLSASGFTVRTSAYAETVDVGRFRIDPDEVIYLCFKPEGTQ